MATIAVDTWPVGAGAGAVRVSSLYVHPVARQQGLASAALDIVYDVCRAEGLDGCRGALGPAPRRREPPWPARLRETEEYRRRAKERDAVRLYARVTLALHLAVRRLPLVRGQEEWARAPWSCDIGEPEGLAYEIGVFEAGGAERRLTGGESVSAPAHGLTGRGGGNSDAYSGKAPDDRQVAVAQLTISGPQEPP
ncbi:GNAT family N-acetyltransferase [Streptomyces sp. NPDC006356]